MRAAQGKERRCIRPSTKKTLRSKKAFLGATRTIVAGFAFLLTQSDRSTYWFNLHIDVLQCGRFVMRKTKNASQKRRVAEEAQDMTTRIERLYQEAATTGLKTMTSQSVGEFNDFLQHFANEMNTYSVRSLEQVFNAWQQFLDAGPLRQVFEFQARYAQNAQNAYEAYVGEISRLGEMYLDVTRRVSKPQVRKRAR
jgi:hypothetical protein